MDQSKKGNFLYEMMSSSTTTKRVLEDESGWKCWRCTFVHEDSSMSNYLSCALCSAPREETTVAFLPETTFAEDIPSISFPLAPYETIEACMHPKGHTSREPEWTVVSEDSHKFHVAEYDTCGVSGTCASREAVEPMPYLQPPSTSREKRRGRRGC